MQNYGFYIELQIFLCFLFCVSILRTVQMRTWTSATKPLCCLATPFYWKMFKLFFARY